MKPKNLIPRIQRPGLTTKISDLWLWLFVWQNLYLYISNLTAWIGGLWHSRGRTPWSFFQQAGGHGKRPGNIVYYGIVNLKIERTNTETGKK